jgi:transcriptional regulator with XRE-family HTH domain
MHNRIKELRQEKGWSMRELAARASTTGSTINKLEKGYTTLDVNWMERLAKAFDVSAEEIMRKSKVASLTDDAEIYEPDDLDLSSFITGEGHLLYKMITNVLDQIGIVSGDILVVDTDPDEIAAVQSGDVVIARLRDQGESWTLVRQFIEPSLLISNSSSKNEPGINLRSQSAGITGVLLSSHSKFRKKRAAR